MRSSRADETTATAQDEQSAGFVNLRKRLAAPGQAAIINDVADMAAELKAAQAHDAAKRLWQIDDYAIAMPPEVIPSLVNPQSAFEELEEVKGKELGSSILWRNVLALVPLLFTWFSLYLATSAYRDEIRRHPDAIYQPFLVLWENGFNRGLWPTFSTVALLDAFLFVAIIFLTWRIHQLERRGQHEARQLVARMDGAVVALVAALGQERMSGLNNPGDWAAAVQRVIDRAMQETRTLNKANEQALKAAQLAIQSAEQRHQDLVRELGQAIVVTLETMRAENAQMIAATAAEAREMFAQASAAHQQLAESSLQAVVEAQHAVGQVDARTREYISQLKQESVQALQSLHEEDRQFLAQTSQEGRDLLLAAGERADDLTRKQLMPAVATFREMIDGFRTDLGQYQQGAKDLVGSIVRIGEVAERLGGSAQIFSTTAQTIDTHLQAVAQTQGQFAGQMASAATEMRAATAEMRATTTQVQNLLASVSEQVSPQIQAMGAQVRDASDSLATTQAKLAETSRGLSRAIEYFRNMPRPKVVISLFGRSA